MYASAYPPGKGCSAGHPLEHPWRKSGLRDGTSTDVHGLTLFSSARDIRGHPSTEYPRIFVYSISVDNRSRNIRGMSCVEYPRIFRAEEKCVSPRTSGNGNSADVRIWNIRGYPGMEHPRTSFSGISAGNCQRNVRGVPCLEHPRMSAQGTSADVYEWTKRGCPLNCVHDRTSL